MLSASFSAGMIILVFTVSPLTGVYDPFKEYYHVFLNFDCNSDQYSL
jgi:hypothetical protein